MAIFSPMTLLSRVDFPALGRPISATTPHFCCRSVIGFALCVFAVPGVLARKNDLLNQDVFRAKTPGTAKSQRRRSPRPAAEHLSTLANLAQMIRVVICNQQHLA